jgi:hypothetical protein
MSDDAIEETQDSITGSKGGKARADKLSSERKKEIAMLGVAARQAPQARATHMGVLRIADFEIPCYVLEDGTRVLSQRGLNDALGAGQGGSTSDRAQKLPRFLAATILEPLISKDLTVRISKPIKCLMPHGGTPASAIPASALPDVCQVWLKAKELGVLKTSKQLASAQKAEILHKALGQIGIIALVDEATGYQGIRPKDALQTYLEMLIRKELAAWAKKFPDEFYENIYKLKGWVWPGMGKNRFSVVGNYTRDLVFERLAPGLLQELESKSPKDDKGNSSTVSPTTATHSSVVA